MSARVITDQSFFSTTFFGSDCVCPSQRSPGLLNNHEATLLKQPLFNIVRKGDAWYNVSFETNVTQTSVTLASARFIASFFLTRAYSLGGACFHAAAGLGDLVHAFVYYNQAAIVEAKTKEEGAVKLATSGIEHLISAVYNCVFLLDTMYLITAAFTLFPGAIQTSSEYFFGAPSKKSGNNDLQSNDAVSSNGDYEMLDNNNNNNNNVEQLKQETYRAHEWAKQAAVALFEKVTVPVKA